MKRFSASFLYVILVGFFLLSPVSSNAASLYIDPPLSELSRGDSMMLAVRLDVDEESGECINAVDGVITYTDNIEPVDISTGESIFNIWVEPPVINKEARTITFAGGIPNGYCGRVEGDPRLTNVITEMVFRSPGFSIGGSGEPEAHILFADTSTAYLNDGRGTKSNLNTYGAKIQLNEAVGSRLNNVWQDRIISDKVLPEGFSISLHQDDKAFSQKYYIIFNSNDKQTGIDHYEVMEEALTQLGTFQWGRADAPWIVARSPYVLDDQSLNSIIRVKAVDKAGNEYIANLVPDESMRTLSRSEVVTYVVTAASFILLLIVLVVAVLYVRARRRKKALLETEDEVDSQDEEEFEDEDEKEGEDDNDAEYEK